MKKTLVALMAMVLGLSMAASALPAVTFDEEGCELTDVLWSTDLLWQHDLWVGLLISADIDELAYALYVDPLAVPPVQKPFDEVDLEGGVGDGLPDKAQLALLAAAVCADADLKADLLANLAMVIAPDAGADPGLIDDLNALVAWADSDGAQALGGATGLGQTLIDFGQSLIGGPYQSYATAIITLGTYVRTFADSILPQVQTGSSTAGLIAALEMVALPIAAEASLGTEMKMTLEMLLGSLIEGLNKPISSLGGMTPAQVCTMLSGNLTTMAGQLNALGQTALAAACVAGAETFADGAVVIAAPAAPSFIVLGAAKLAGEPFSGAGDYDGDTISNAATYAAVMANGGSLESFVGAASGATPFYPGNPLMPAAGLIGLAALVSAIAGGGAFVLRRK